MANKLMPRQSTIQQAIDITRRKIKYGYPKPIGFYDLPDEESGKIRAGLTNLREEEARLLEKMEAAMRCVA